MNLLFTFHPIYSFVDSIFNLYQSHGDIKSKLKYDVNLLKYSWNVKGWFYQEK